MNEIPSGDYSQEDIAKAAYTIMENNVMVWGQAFFPHHFRMRSPHFHREMLEAVKNHARVSVAAPRESAKSTLLVFLYPFHRIVFKKKRFILLISNTFKKSAMHLDSIKREIADNALFKQTFPPINIVRDAEGDSEFRHPDGFMTKFLCKGVDQIGSVRGVKFGASRPDLIIADDMEDDELVKSTERRNQLKEDYDTALLPAGDRETCQYINVGTILHDDCQMAKLVSKDEYTDFFKLFYAAHIKPDTPDESSLWPEKWSIEYLKQLRRDKPNVYAKEMQNNPVAGGNTRFQQDDFRYWRLEQNKALLFNKDNSLHSAYSVSDLKAAISCDLAWKQKRDSDSTVLMPGFLTPNSEVLIDSYISKKGMRPDELSEQLFIMVERLEKLTNSNVPCGFEKSMLENVSQWLIKREMKKRNRFITTKELVWDTDKNTRIETRLQPRYAQHVIYHLKDMGDLEHQLERFPFGAFDDLVDAEQGLIQLLQFPKEISKPDSGISQFDWWRQQAIDAKTVPQHHLGNFRKKRTWTVIPAKQAWR